MNRFFYPLPILGSTIEITDVEEIKHMDRVLRLKAGEQVEICDSTGRVFISEIVDIQKKSVLLNALEEDFTQRELSFQIDLIQGLPKASKMDMIIQKNVELGVHAIRAVEFKRCVTRLKDASETGKIERWQKIADEASKQAKRNRQTRIDKSLPFKELLKNMAGYDLILVAYENATASLKAVLEPINPQRIAVIIGPEGGFEEEEVAALEQLGAKVVSLGTRILRTETAGIFVLSALAYAYEDRGLNP
jgi:16S rRNA (uracil1498-N3)-methyltransferase